MSQDGDNSPVQKNYTSEAIQVLPLRGLTCEICLNAVERVVVRWFRLDGGPLLVCERCGSRRNLQRPKAQRLNEPERWGS